MRIFKAFSLTVIAMLAVSSAAWAQETGPVQVASCIVHPRDAMTNILKPGVDWTNGVTVTLVNKSDKTTSAVTVHGSYHGTSVTDTVDLYIAPGKTAQVTRNYTPTVFSDIYAECHVVKVTFTDGTSWSAPPKM
jgi:hypothetical protein